MAKNKRIQFINTFYDSGRPKYEAGRDYPVTRETLSQVVAGHAKEIEVEASTEGGKADKKTAKDADSGESTKATEK